MLRKLIVSGCRNATIRCYKCSWNCQITFNILLLLYDILREQWTFLLYKYLEFQQIVFLHSNKKLMKNEKKKVVTLIRDILKGTGQKDLELRTNYCLCKSVSIGLPSLRYYSFIHLSMLLGLPWSYFLLSCAHSKSYKT